MSASVSLQDLTVRRGETTVLSALTLHIPQGEFVAIVGKSGAGKSTLLHALAGHIPMSGESSVPRRIGMVFQQFAVFPWMTAAQNISFGLRMDKETKAKIVEEHLRLAGLETKASVYPAALSGGQQQRIAIARALAHSPDLLLMDEPFGSLDAYTREQMQDWLRTVWQTQKITVIFVTHSIEEALMLADRIVVLRDGSIRAEFFPKQEHADRKDSEQFWKMHKKIHDTL